MEIRTLRQVRIERDGETKSATYATPAVNFNCQLSKNIVMIIMKSISLEYGNDIEVKL